jgi:hypothetical protein
MDLMDLMDGMDLMDATLSQFPNIPARDLPKNPISPCHPAPMLIV